MRRKDRKKDINGRWRKNKATHNRKKKRILIQTTACDKNDQWKNCDVKMWYNIYLQIQTQL